MPAAPPKAAEPLTVIYASESGNSEKLAGDVGKLARKQGFKPKVVDFADLDVATLPKAAPVLKGLGYASAMLLSAPLALLLPAP